MKFELKHIRAFIAVAEELHFRRAAERLYTTQPGLSRTIRWLEEQVGAELLLRTTRYVELTPAGEVFLGECKQALEQLERGISLARSAAAGDIGHITVAYMDFAINGALPQILECFRRVCPHVRVKMQHMPSAEQKEALTRGDIDLGVLIGPFHAADTACLTLGRESLVVLLPISHPLASLDAVSLSDLAQEPFICGTEGSWSTFRRLFFELFHKAGLSPHIVQEASTSDGIFGLVAANIGVALYTECVSNIQRRGLVVKPLRGVEEEVETVAVWRTPTKSASVDKFVEVLRQFDAKPPS